MEETGKTEEVAGGPGRKKPGAPKTKWTPEEENALKEGVGRYGAGKWRAIQKDPELAKALSTRSNVDLKVRVNNSMHICEENYVIRTTETDVCEGRVGKIPHLISPTGEGECNLDR